MLTKKKNGLSRGELRAALEVDLALGGGVIKRTILFTDCLMEHAPGAWLCDGRRILCGMQAEDFVAEGLHQLLRGDRRAYRLDSGLRTAVQQLVHDARSTASDEALLGEVRARFRPPAQELPGGALPTLLGDPLAALVAGGLLGGLTPIEIADRMGCPLMPVLMRARRVERMAASG